MIRQRIKAGLKRAVAQGVKLGRPKIDSTTEGAKAACEGCGHLEGGEVARDRDWHGPSHLKRAWLKASTAILPLSPSFLCVAPGCGWIGNGQPHFVLPPNLYKVPPPRGGGLRRRGRRRPGLPVMSVLDRKGIGPVRILDGRPLPRPQTKLAVELVVEVRAPLAVGAPHALLPPVHHRIVRRAVAAADSPHAVEQLNGPGRDPSCDLLACDRRALGAAHAMLGLQAEGLGGRPGGLMVSTLRPRRSKVRVTNARAASSSLTAG